MNIAEFFRNHVFQPLISKAACLVVYDPERRYHDICLAMASEQLMVVDASQGSIESRLAALQALRELGHKPLTGLLVYVPKRRPDSYEEQQIDPFAAIAAAGAVFPDGDGDSFESWCVKARPDQTKAIQAVFAQDPSPAFAVIDAIGGGLDWPNLRALLKVESPNEILLALLTPSSAQQAALQAKDGWLLEARGLLRNSLGLALKTKGKTWSAVADELWRFVLFSEFVFDLPAPLPTALANVPMAEAVAKPLVESLCNTLRSDLRSQSAYIDRAEEIEKDLDLPAHCGDWADLGERDTFPFEERTFLKRAIEWIMRDDMERVRQILGHHNQSVWTGKAESRAQWDLIAAAANLVQCCDDLDNQLAGQARDLETLLAFYISRLREADRLHREFEQAVADCAWQDAQGIMTPMMAQVRQQYGKLAEKVQRLFTRHVEQSGWPLAGYLANADVFNRMLAPKLQKNGHKVAYFMVDALRFELGIALEQQLADDGVVQLQAALAQLPSITAVGMASLLPGAGQLLRLVNDNQSIVPYLGEQIVDTVARRMDVFKKRYGERFQEGRLEDFVRSRFDVLPDTDLLVLRSVEIDSHFENHPDTAPAEITNALKRIRNAIHMLKGRGFSEVLIATDHGFFINTHAGVGDVCAKPAGNWLPVHDRCALGEGVADAAHFVSAAEKMGIRGDFAKFAAPQTLAAYRSGLLYYHGGASLQECVVPVITVQLKRTAQPALQQATVLISYKNGAKSITTRMPVIHLSVQTSDMFSTDSALEILLEAHNSAGEVVGEAKAGGMVNPATGTLSLLPGANVQVTIKMQTEFEGKFKIKALNPSTYTAYCQLELETNYTV